MADGGVNVDHPAQQQVVIKAYHKALHFLTTYQSFGDKDCVQKEEYCKCFEKLVPNEGKARSREEEQEKKALLSLEFWR